MPEVMSYAVGAIVKIHLENFVTYTSVEFQPGPKLNVIIGPNGTGKSTIVCGICLGLGGPPNLLGRATSAAEYIKHGANKAVIELELCLGEDNRCVVRREIGNAHSTWSIDKKPTTEKHVKEFASSLGIQVDNLCQFLPQEKVSDFAKMSPQELLSATEKAVSPELYQQHRQLKTAGEQQRKYELDVQRVRERLEREVGLNSGLEHDVQNFQLRLKNTTKLELYKKKRCWVDYGNAREEYNASRNEKKECSRQLNALKEKFAPLRQRHQAAVQENERIDTLVQRKHGEAQTHEQAIDKTRRHITDLGEKVQLVDDEFSQLKRDEENRRRKLRELQQQLATLKSEQAAIDNTQDLQPEIDKVNDAMRALNNEMTNVQNEGEKLKRDIMDSRGETKRMEEEIRKLSDIGNQRLEILRSKHLDTYKAVLWLRSNQHLFSHPVHEPMMLSINVNDPRFAKYVESRISFNDMKAFMCETAADMDIFFDQVKDGLHYHVNAVLMPSTPASSFQPKQPISHYRRYGFHSYVRELFSCPEPVLRYLCQMYRVHEIPVGNAQTKDNIQIVQRECPEFKILYTENHEYSVKKSQYSGQTSSRCSTLYPSSLLGASVDRTRENQLVQKLQTAQANVQQQEAMYVNMQNIFKNHETKMNELRSERKRLDQKKNEGAQLQSKISMKVDSIKRSEAGKLNLEAEQTRVAEQKKRIYEQKKKLIETVKQQIQEFIRCGQDTMLMCLQRISAQRAIKAIEAELGNEGTYIEELETKLKKAMEDEQQKKQLATRKFEEACRATNTKPTADGKLSPEYERSFSVLPQSIQELDTVIHDLQTRIDCSTAIDRTVMDDYEARKRTIATLEGELNAAEVMLNGHKANIDDIKLNWLDPVKVLIQKISKEFSRFFDMMSCAGEVDLQVPDNQEDYDKYGMCVKVKFRDTEELRELDAHHQSGGERSVSTVLYMMALQELTKCPFRCCDEINQGMDPNNERLIFEIVVETVARERASQYFLLTPKLLPDLSYNDNMMILSVHSGKHLLKQTEWNVDKFIRRRRQLV